MAYGVQLFDGSSVNIFDTNTDKLTSAVNSGSVTATIPSSSPYTYTSGAISFSGILSTNSSTHDVFLTGNWPPVILGNYGTVQVLRPGSISGSNPANGTFKIRMNGYFGVRNQSYVINYIAAQF
jgi:hypothetical protein